MKKVIASILCFTMCAGMFAGCKGKDDKKESATTASGNGDTTASATEGSSSAESSESAADSSETEASSEDTTTEVTTAIESYGTGSIEINMFAMSPEVPGMVKRFMADNPDMASKYKVTAMVSANTNGAYVTKLNAALTAGGDGAPDIYVAEADYILPYTQGDLSSLAAPYADFIDNVDGKLKDAQIAQYTIDLGTNTDGKLVALCYQC
ncbi:MAG TPA: hypothetical protein DCW43_05755, partial [Clostridiales bacterium]|nr:hypothetical protein [Clostridiales bacterium]